MKRVDYALTLLRRRAANGYPWALSAAEAGAIVSEVEYLRSERRAVVAFLREQYDTHSVQDAADNIERGEHRRGETL